MNFDVIVQYIFSGLTYGSIYAVVAIGFNIIYNSTGIINFAQGEFVMLGSMSAYTFSHQMPLVPAIILAVLLTTLIGSLIELVFIRGLVRKSQFQMNVLLSGAVVLILSVLFHGKGSNPALFFPVTGICLVILILLFNGLWIFFKPFSKLFQSSGKADVLQMIVLTIGLSIILREIALHIWGEQVRTLPYFTGNEVSSLGFLGAHFSPQILWVIGTTALIVIGLTLFFQFTLTGQAMRGCSANMDGARLCGINPQRMVNLSFALSAGIGALAGCVTAPLTQTHYAIGTELAIKGFTVAIFGGLGNSVAAVFAGLLLGILESFSIVIFPEAFKDVVTIGILLIILVVRPSGLFGSKTASSLKEF